MNHGGATPLTAEMDDEGREIYTFEVNWTGSEYEIKVNGVVLGGQAQTTTLLEKLNPNGDFFVGITLRDSYKGEGAAAGFTILEFGTSASDATKPVGDDEKEPEENGFIDYPIISADTVEANMPAILWTPETYKLTSGNNINFTAKGDNTWAASATEAAVFFSLSPKRKWSYDAEEFPVFGIMLRNLWVDTGTLWYAAGEVPGPSNGYTMSFSVYDGQFYGEDDEYVFVPYDMTGLWEGRINAVRLDMNIVDESTRDFDLCFAGMFRSEDEAYAYAEAWITNVTGEAPEVGGEDESEDDTAASGGVEDTTAAEVEDTTAASGNVEETTVASGDNDDTAANAEATTVADGEGDKDEDEKSGCGAVVGFGAVAVLAAAAAAVALKKKD